MAHTYFVFDFEDQPPVAISVEARRERGESYDVVRGMFNEFELIYIWGYRAVISPPAGQFSRRIGCICIRWIYRSTRPRDSS